MPNPTKLSQTEIAQHADSENVVGGLIDDHKALLDLFSGMLRASAVYDAANLVDAAGVTTTVACVGAALGDFVLASFSLDLQGITMTAYVSAADVVSIRFQNESGGAIDLASGTIRVAVIKQAAFVAPTRTVTRT